MATSQTIEFRDPGVRAAASAASADELQDLHGDKLVLNGAGLQEQAGLYGAANAETCNQPENSGTPGLYTKPVKHR